MEIETHLKNLSKINIINQIKLTNFLLKQNTTNRIKCLKIIITQVYSLNYEFPNEFYELINNNLIKNNYKIYNIINNKDIYQLISYLLYENEDTEIYKEIITPLQYFQTPKKHIKLIIEKLKTLKLENHTSTLYNTIKDEKLWLLKKPPQNKELDYIALAYKLYLSIGLINTSELLEDKYGTIDYEQIYYLFNNLDVKNNNQEYIEIFNKFLFDDKKDNNNVIRQILHGNLQELFLNFDYFYNHLDYFINKLGTKMNKNKVILLLQDRYLSQDVTNPSISRDIFDDMVSSYYCKYIFKDTSDEEIYNKNIDIYNNYLKHKYKSSIPQIPLHTNNEYIFEILNLDAPRNLVMGYRSGNCFRINGDAASLFKNFLISEHIRLISISTKEIKDFAMILIYRNGNVLVAQEIEVSKRVPSELKGKKLYETSKQILKEIMDYMNKNGDSIIATIIGASNENVSSYNNQPLQFLIPPIKEIKGNYYNGIYNYQCLLDLTSNKNINDIKLEIPKIRYYDEIDKVMKRYATSYDKDYLNIEQTLISLRYRRTKKEQSYYFYITQSSLNQIEIYTCCHKDFYITLYNKGYIDTFIDTEDERIKKIYEDELKETIKMKEQRERKNKYGLIRKMDKRIY